MARNQPKLARLRPSSINVCTESTKAAPDSTKFGQSSVEVCASPTKLGPPEAAGRRLSWNAFWATPRTPELLAGVHFEHVGNDLVFVRVIVRNTQCVLLEHFPRTTCWVFSRQPVLGVGLPSGGTTRGAIPQMRSKPGRCMEYTEFLAAMLHLRDDLPETAYRAAFRALDCDDDGSISVHDIVRTSLVCISTYMAHGEDLVCFRPTYKQRRNAQTHECPKHRVGFRRTSAPTAWRDAADLVVLLSDLLCPDIWRLQGIPIRIS